MKNTTNSRRVIAAVAALAGIGAGVLLSQQDASAGRLVTGKQIADSSLTGKDLRDGTVTSQDITDGSLSPGDFDLPDVGASLRAGPGALLDGPEGDKGPTGPTGNPGPQGHSGITDLKRVTTSSTVASQQHGTVTTPCPAGTRVIAGGVLVDGLAALVPINVSAPLNQGAGWQSMVRNGSASAVTVNGWAVCASAF